MGAIKKCKLCSKVFSALTNKRLYCDKCKFINNKNYKRKLIEGHTCLNCGRAFVTRRSVKKFCGGKCRNEHHRQYIVKIKICRNCETQFETTTDKKEYHNRECYLIAKRKRDRIYYKEHK